MYRRNLCFICQNPSIVIDKSRTLDSKSNSIEKCESCGKLVCHNCSYICSRCNRFVCSVCENTVYESNRGCNVGILPRERRLFVSTVVAAASSCLFASSNASSLSYCLLTNTHTLIAHIETIYSTIPSPTPSSPPSSSPSLPRSSRCPPATTANCSAPSAPRISPLLSTRKRAAPPPTASIPHFPVSPSPTSCSISAFNAAPPRTDVKYVIKSCRSVRSASSASSFSLATISC